MFEFTLEDHPHKVNVHGVAVQVIKDVLLVKVKSDQHSGRFISCGYCGAEPGKPITLIKYYPEVFRAAVKEFVEDRIGEVTQVSCPPPSGGRSS